MKSYYVYIMASFKRVLYIGVTSALQGRTWQHKNEVFDSGFTKRYHIHKLVYFEEYSHIVTALTREKELKRWTRAKKIALISTSNPKWKDLSLAWGKKFLLPMPPSARPARQ
jgi:putative endonuclease